jgi:hypothetical protein
MRHVRPIPIIIVLLLCSPVLADDRKKAVADSFEKLADRDSEVRRRAKQDLMGLEPGELDLLRQVVSARTPLRPAQVDPLHDIVIYIRVRAAINKLPKVQGGFLGVSLPNLAIENEDQRPAGVQIVNRLQGFVAYRLLEDGDIITAIGPENEMLPIYTPDHLRMIVRNFAAGQMIHVRVVRGTRSLTVQFPLDAPIASEDLDRGVQADINEAEYDAEQYWERNFAPLLAAEEV